MQYLTIREEEASVISITARKRHDKNESFMLLQANVIKMEDTDTTSEKF